MGSVQLGAVNFSQEEARGFQPTKGSFEATLGLDGVCREGHTEGLQLLDLRALPGADDLL